MTKAKLLAAYKDNLLADYAWAQDPAKLAKFMASVTLTITSLASTWNHDSPAMTKAWKSLGGTGKPTLKALRAVPY